MLINTKRLPSVREQLPQSFETLAVHHPLAEEGGLLVLLELTSGVGGL